MSYDAQNGGGENLMMGWLSKAVEAVSPDCTPDYPRGSHGTLVGGRGGMGDAMCCLRCGREKYEELWTREEVDRQVPLTDELVPALERARRLPAGIHADEAEGEYHARAAIR